MQRPLITVQGGKPKKRLGLVSARAVCAAALVLPGRVRVYFVFLLNFIYNRAPATARLIISFLGRRSADVLVFLVYYLALGPAALLSRLTGKAESAPGGSFFTDKEPEDASAERFERQY